jgi:hypothetical protein
MRRTLVLLVVAPLLALCAARSGATTYYVAQIGSDSNAGTRAIAPFQHLFKAASVVAAGDTVCVIDSGTYTVTSEGLPGQNRSVLHIATSGRPDAYVTFRACDGAAPTIDRACVPECSSQRTVYYGIEVEANYIQIGPGFTEYGDSDQTTVPHCLAAPRDFICNGVGFGIYGHHITVIGNVAHDNGCAGIGGLPARYEAGNPLDYIRIIANTVYRNANDSSAGCSGISLYELTDFDTGPGIACPGSVAAYHNCIVGNLAYDNAELIDEGTSGRIEDGNGCIIDDSQHTQHPALGPAYTGTTLVANNIFAGNGGSGCHGYHSDNIDFINNTAYRNMRTGNAATGCAAPCAIDGDLGNYLGSRIRFFNNLVDSRDTTSAYSIFSRCGEAGGCEGDYNLRHRGAGTGVAGPHDLTGDPALAAPKTRSAGDFHLGPSSPARDTGTTAHALENDYYGQARPKGRGYDIGAAAAE